MGKLSLKTRVCVLRSTVLLSKRTLAFELFVLGMRTHLWFCPDEARGLSECWGEEFEKKYEAYEKEGLARKTIEAEDLWRHIVDTQIETGTPYMVYKDACNRKSNQQNLGTIKSSNLCTEIVEYTSEDEIAVCNLASIALPRYVKPDGTFDFKKLHEVTKVAAKNLNKIIDVNYYPVKEARNSNMRHRPIGVGVQGLADTFILMGHSFDDENARQLNKHIFETIYHAAMEASMDEAKINGPYSTYEGSPVSKGIFQFDMWNVTPSNLWDWAALKLKVKEFGIRNSLLIAPMPTASTAQILGNNESIEPFTSNIYSRRVLAGEFQVINQHLLKELTDMGLWNDDMRQQMIANLGSIQAIFGIPAEIKRKYRTVWEISQKSIIEMAADRAPFICQSQSLNIHIAQPSYAKISSMHFFGWNKGLKTGMYYLRSKAAANAIQFTVDKTKVYATEKSEETTQNKTEIKPIKLEFNNKTTVSASVGLEGDNLEQSKENLKPVENLVKKEETDVEAVTEQVARVRLTPEEEARLLCSLENKEACMMCSG